MNRLFNKTSNNVFLLALFEAIIWVSMFMELLRFFPYSILFNSSTFPPVFLRILQWVKCCDVDALCHFNFNNDPVNTIDQLHTIDPESFEVESSEISRWAEEKRESMNLRKCSRKVSLFLETLLDYRRIITCCFSIAFK